MSDLILSGQNNYQTGSYMSLQFEKGKSAQQAMDIYNILVETIKNIYLQFQLYQAAQLHNEQQKQLLIIECECRSTRVKSFRCVFGSIKEADPIIEQRPLQAISHKQQHWLSLNDEVKTARGGQRWHPSSRTH